MKKKYVFIWCVLVCAIILNVASCGKEDIDTKKEKDLEFTVMEEADIPEEFLKQINEKKQETLKMSFSDKEYLYIAIGYGEQDTGGYSITVDSLFSTKNAIYIYTTLVGPSENDMVLKAKTYPYIVIKTEYMEKNVIFD